MNKNYEKDGWFKVCQICGLWGHVDMLKNGQTKEECIEEFLSSHTKEFCDKMVTMNEELENNCPYPCCNKGK